MVADPCLTPPSSCNLWIYQSEPMQRYLLLQLLNSLLASPLALSVLQTYGSAWACAGGTYKIKALQAQMIADGLADPSTAQPVCWRPEELEGAIAYLVCALVAQVNPPIT